jgi:2-methylisocitrate lyase-like PEP mutase family enzyme
MTSVELDDIRARFRQLHVQGTFTMPNPHDLGSCRLFESLGFPALATTSGGYAASLGRPDMSVRRDELVGHVAALTGSTDLPLNVDAEQCFPHDEGGIARTVELLAGAGASGCSIEDWDPVEGRLTERGLAAEHVAIAADAAHRTGLVLTARAENHLRGVDDLDDTIGRLSAYRDAGADVLYAPALVDLDQIERVVTETAMPVNVLLRPGGPSVDQLAERGVRRISVGGTLALVAYGALYQAALRLRDDGVIGTDEPFLARDVVANAFRPG